MPVGEVGEVALYIVPDIGIEVALRFVVRIPGDQQPVIIVGRAVVGLHPDRIAIDRRITAEPFRVLSYFVGVKLLVQ